MPVSDTLDIAAKTRIPPAIQPLLDEYIRLTAKDLPGFITAFYLHGSVALDAFQDGLSDIDFVAVISRPCSASDLEQLAAIHRALETQYPRWPLSGSYLQASDLGQLTDTMPKHPHYHDGVLHPSGHHDINAVTWWVLKNRGIALLGPEPTALAYEVDWPKLTADMLKNINTYWASFTTNPARIAWLWSDYGIQWTVLGVLRQFYTFKENAITSKTGAGEYALTHWPARWHRLFQEALNIRAQKSGSLYRFKMMRVIEAFLFLKEVIRAANAFFDAK